MSRTSYLRRPLTALLVGAALAASVLMAVVVLASPAWAATYTVKNTNDAGPGSLRQAIIDANTNTGSADTINFDAMSLGSSATITLTSGQLPPITDVAGLTIDGGSADITISGNEQYRVFLVDSGAKLTLSNLTVANGNSGFEDDGRGGGIYNGQGGTVTVSNSTLSGNSAGNGNGGGGIYNGGFGTLEVINSTLSGNSSNDSGGGIFSRTGTVTVSNSTLSDNSAPIGGGILTMGDTLEVSNSTLSGNSASEGGGIYDSGADTITVSNSTLSDNSAPIGGGNCDGVGDGTIANGGYNLDSDTSCGFGTNNNSLSGVDPMLGPLADNGGPTKTHALLAGSPAIDKGNSSFEATTDQRGLPRPIDFVGILDAADGDGSDIGSFERQLQEPDTTPPKVISTVPANGREVGPTANVKATFSEDMQTASVKNAFKLFKKGSTTQIAAQVSYDAATDKATLNPTNNLRRGVTYRAVVSTVAKDVAGNRLDQDDSTTSLQQKVWYFTVD
jgi:Bacterial Ig-like domain